MQAESRKHIDTGEDSSFEHFVGTPSGFGRRHCAATKLEAIKIGALLTSGPDHSQVQ